MDVDVTDDDDDVHLCLRCRQKIIGLEEYIAHRKSGLCNRTVEVVYVDNDRDKFAVGNVSEEKSTSVGSFSGSGSHNEFSVKKNAIDCEGSNKQIEDNKKSIGPKVLAISDNLCANNDKLNESLVKSKTIQSETESDPSLKADDFFSLLELQSSSKSTGFPGISVPSNTGYLNKPYLRGARTSYGIVTRSKSLAKSKENAKSLQVSKETQHVGDKLFSKKDNSLPTSPVNLYFNPNVVTEHESISISELRNAVSESAISKKMHHSTNDDYVTIPDADNNESVTYNETVTCTQANEDLEEDIDDPEDEEDDDDEEGVNPPRSHTGGKWKPGGIPGLDSNWKVEDSWTNQPPPTHTGGKWKPFIPSLSDSKDSPNQVC